MEELYGVPQEIEIEFEDVEFDSSVREKRRTVDGRHELLAQGKKVNNGGKSRSSIPATNRRFVAWDGEGETVQISTKHGVPWIKDDNEHHLRHEHRFILFGNSDGDYVSGKDLGTYECLTLLTKYSDPNAIHIGFSFSYDVNMILRDVSRKHLEHLAKKNVVRWGEFRIEYIPAKWFMVTDTKASRTVKIWDVWSFFMTSFVKTCQQYGIEPGSTVSEGKAERSGFTYDNIEYVVNYWKAENDKLVELMEKFRATLYGAELFITNWHGPGAIASYTMSANKIQNYKSETPEHVYDACQYGYSGGRMELYKVGRANHRVYQYDINSAYPHAISQLPNLAEGHWEYVENPTQLQKFGIYKVSFEYNPYRQGVPDQRTPMPFFHRNQAGSISYPCIVYNWVWSPELSAAIEAGIPGIHIKAGWEFHPKDSDDKPFAFIAENYKKRKQWQDDENPSQLALKLQMNSIYGKLAQRVGWNEEKGTPPKWHSLDWAGWITSYTRAKLYRAILKKPKAAISVETDAIFSSEILSLDIGPSLGQWEVTVYDDIIYLQSGCYFALQDGEWKDKYRGFDKGSISVNDAVRALEKEPDDWRIYGTTTRFVGFKQALKTDFSSWRTWENNKYREMGIGKDGKRQHMEVLCSACTAGKNGNEMMHDLAIADPIGGQSYKHPIPWKDDSLDNMQTLADDMKWEI